MSASEDPIGETGSLIDESVIADLMSLSDSWRPWVVNVEQSALSRWVSV